MLAVYNYTLAINYLWHVVCSRNETKHCFVIVEIATVTTTYNAVSAEQLSLSPGQLILVKRKHPDGWWEGELQVRTLNLHCNCDKCLQTSNC